MVVVMVVEVVVVMVVEVVGEVRLRPGTGRETNVTRCGKPFDSRFWFTAVKTSACFSVISWAVISDASGTVI